jgi:hypothetical protein
MQKTAQEVAHFVTSHNQKQQHTQCKRQTQKPANRPQEVVHCKPKTTTNKQKQNNTVAQRSTNAKPTEEISAIFSIGYLHNAGDWKTENLVNIKKEK